MKPMLFALLTALMTTACAHKITKPTEPSALVYPHGTYQHRVKVQIVEPQRNLEVKGVIKSQPDELKVVGISSFGTTVFRIDENLKTGEVNKEFYVESLRRNEDRFMFFYSLMKELLLAPKGATEFEKQGAKFALSNPDENQIPRTVRIQHPQVNLNIEVTDYEF